MQINTGNGNWCKNDMLLLCSIYKHNPDIVIISESNFSNNQTNLNRRQSMFPGFKAYDKFFTNHDTARLTVLIKAELECERDLSLENDINPTIVLKLKASKNKHMYIIGNYRQWKGVSPTCPYNSKSEDDAVNRFEDMISIWTNTVNKKRPTYILGDINIDRREENDPENRPDLKRLIPILTEFQKTHKFILTNKKATRHRVNQNPTLLDLVLTNAPDTILGNEYCSNFCSEHKVIVTKIKTSPINVNAQFINTRDYKNITPDNLNSMISSSQVFNEIFNEDDPNIITDKYINEMNRIINTLAPTRRIQVNKRNKTKLSDEVKEAIDKADAQKTIATNSQDREEYRLARNLQLKLNKLVEKEKAESIKRNLKGKYKWKKLNENKDTDKTPTRIIDEDKDVTSPKSLTKLFNKYFIEKIEKIREKFKTNNKTAMDILSSLIEKPKTTFTFKTTDVYTIYKIIDKSKHSKSAGSDAITMSILKDCPQISARVICHIYNNMIRTNLYPDRLKISKIIPIVKSGKDKTDKTSYRPINILPTVDKVIESVMKEQLEEYFESNSLIPNEHHGGRKNHSTVTATAAMDLNHNEIKEDKDTVAIMATDLSSAFDLVDHNLLIEKLKYYGLDKNACEILENFMKDRKVFTNIQGFNSEIMNAPNCSVIQGSKLSGFLFTLFSIEIPLLPRIMKDAQLAEVLMEIKIPQFYGIRHQVNQYVDDSTNIIGTDNKDELEIYLTNYHKVLEIYYTANKLKLNGDKTQLIVTRRKWKNKDNTKVQFKTTEGDTIKEVNAIRILGFLRNNRNSYDSHLGVINGRITQALAEIKPYVRYMDPKSRKEVIYSKIASIALYGAELLTGQTEWTKAKFTSILMKCNRMIFYKDWFKVSNRRICREIQVDHPLEIIKKSTLKMFHKMVWLKSPVQIYNKLKFNNRHRECSAISLKKPLSKQVSRRTPIVSGLNLFNNLQIGMKMTHPKKFKKLLKKNKIWTN